MATASPPTPADAGSFEALKRVKAAENEWEAKLATAKHESEAALGRLRDETDTAVKAAQAQAEQERAAMVQRARADADREATTILAEGTRAAAEATRGEGKHPRDKKDPVLAAVLGGFVSN